MSPMRDGRTNEQTTSEDRATQLLICEKLSLAITLVFGGPQIAKHIEKHGHLTTMVLAHFNGCQRQREVHISQFYLVPPKLSFYRFPGVRVYLVSAGGYVWPAGGLSRQSHHLP